jgi:hypothetical protein
MRDIMMSGRKKALLAVIVVLLIGVHAGLFAAGGTWRTMGLALVGVDLFSAWFVFGAVREMKKLDQQDGEK